MTDPQPHARWSWPTLCAVLAAITALITATTILF